MDDYALRFNKLPDHVRWICDGEMSVALGRDTGGIVDVAYFGAQPFHALQVFAGDFLKVKIGDQLHQFNDVQAYPFGVASRHEEVEVAFAVMRNTLEVKVDNPKRREITFLLDESCKNRQPDNMFWESVPYDSVNQALRFYFAAFLNQHRQNPNPQKDMMPDSPDLCHFPDRLMCGQVYVAAGTAGGSRHRAQYNVHTFSSDAAQSKFLIAFGQTNQECLARFNEHKGSPLFDAQKERYGHVYAKAPKINLRQHPELAEMVNLMPLCYESLKVRGQSVRATAAATYWVWGWDGILAAFGMLWAKDYDYVKDMIRFYIATARPSGKIAHQYGTDMLPTIHVTQHDLADYLMLALISRYFDFNGDAAFLAEVAPYYAKSFASIAAMADGETGFVACEGVYPDFPWKVAGRERTAYPCMEQTSLFAICVQAEAFGLKTNDHALSRSAGELKDRLKRHFTRHFFDNAKGYLYESISVDGLKPNPCYPKWNIFGIGLQGGESLFDAEQMKRMAEFALKNFFAADDLRSMPLWDKGAKLAPHGSDVGIWTTLSYPIEDLSLYKLFKCAKNQEGMSRTLSRMERIYSNLKLAPELVPTSQEEFKEDLYTNTRSSWQAFTMGMWHCVVMEGLLSSNAENGEIKNDNLPQDEVTCEGY